MDQDFLGPDLVRADRPRAISGPALRSRLRRALALGGGAVAKTSTSSSRSGEIRWLDLRRLCALSATLGLGCCLLAVLDALRPGEQWNERPILLAFNASTLVATTCLCMLLVDQRSRAPGKAPGWRASPWLWIPALAGLDWVVEAAVHASGLGAVVEIMLTAEAGALAVIACALWGCAPFGGQARGRQPPLGSGVLGAVLDCSNDGMVTIGLDGAVTAWNPAAEQMLGWKAHEAIGRSIVWAIPSDRAIEERELLERMRAGGRIERYETKLRRKDGGAVEVAVTASPIFDGRGTVVGVVRALQNLTLVEERKARLRRRQAELAHRSRIQAVNDLSAAVAHEINQPLAAIGNLLAVAGNILEHEDGHPGPEELPAAARAVRLAAEQAMRAGHIISHVRAFMARGEVEVRPERLDQMVEGALSLAVLADGSQTTVHKSIEPNLLVWADRIQIEQVVVNLVKNAFEAMRNQPAQTRRLKVTAGLSADPHFAEVCITDTGPGLADPAEPQSKPFISDKPGGLGIGLSISRRIIVAHGGRLSSLSGAVGAQFRFTIPLSRGERGSEQ
jgi:two-component system sensor kinase FixL